MRELPEMETKTIDEKWEILKTAILDAAKRVCGTNEQSKYKNQTPWWTRKIKEQIKNQKDKWRKYLQMKTQQSNEEYKQERIKSKKMINDEKQKKWEEFGCRMKQNAKRNQKIFYRTIKSLMGEKKK